jgi:cell division protein FtsL
MTNLTSRLLLVTLLSTVLILFINSQRINVTPEITKKNNRIIQNRVLQAVSGTNREREPKYDIVFGNYREKIPDYLEGCFVAHPDTDYYRNTKGALREISQAEFLANKKSATLKIFGKPELDKNVHTAFSNFLKVKNPETILELLKMMGKSYGGLTAVIIVAVVFFLFLIVIIIWSVVRACCCKNGTESVEDRFSTQKASLGSQKFGKKAARWILVLVILIFTLALVAASFLT